MRLAKKIMKAEIIDSFILALFIAIVYVFVFLFWLKITDPCIQWTILVPVTEAMFFLKPLLFKNASIGMRLVGLRIVDRGGDCPPAKMILYRTVNFITLGKEWKKRWLADEDLYYWGLYTVGTHIVEV